MYDVIVIGGGPAGVSAAIYCGRKKLNTLFIAREIGGQSTVSVGIENWIGTPRISGLDLAKALEDHVRAQKDLVIQTGEDVSEVVQEDGVFVVRSDKGTYRSRAIILCAGSHRRKLDVPGEKKFEGKGVMYCATCDAPIFTGQRVAVVGGGNAGLESVVDLLPYAEHVTLFVRGDAPKGDPVTLDKIRTSEKVTILTNTNITGVQGENLLTGVTYTNAMGQEETLAVSGVFVEIGALPNSHIAPKNIEKNTLGEIVINHRTGETSIKGFFAAGDVTDVAFKQNNISAGDAVKAALSAYKYLQHS